MALGGSDSLTIKTGFTYSKTRSIYSFEELFNQTINTIKSIRKYIPYSHIVLFDNSNLSDINKKTLTDLTDCFINVTDNKLLNYYTDSKYKCIGEMAQTCYFYDYYLKNIHNKNVITNFFKISGRYLINDKFNLSSRLFKNKYSSYVILIMIMIMTLI